MDRVEYIETKLNEELCDADLFELWNMYCESNNYYEDYIYDMGEFDAMADGYTPTELLEHLDDFDINDSYFKEGIYGFTSGGLYDFVDSSTLAEWIDFHDEDNGTGILEDYEDEYGEDEEDE